MKTFTEWYNDRGFKTDFDKLSDRYKDLVVAMYISALGHQEIYNALREEIQHLILIDMEKNLE